MGETVVTKRYAEGYAEYARSTIGIPRAITEIKSLRDIIRENPEFMVILLSPGLTQKEKFAFIDSICTDNFSPETAHLLKLLVEKNRAYLLGGILDYVRINYSHEEEMDAILKSAYPLDLGVVRQLKEKLEHKFGRKLHLYQDIDGELLAGVQVIIGNIAIDGSLKRRLEELREKLKTARLG